MLPSIQAAHPGGEGKNGTWTDVDVINGTNIGPFVNYGGNSV